MQLSQKLEDFSKFFSWFFESTSSLKHFKRKIILKNYALRKLRTPKDVVR